MLRRTAHGWYLVGRKHYLTVKWVPGWQAITSGLYQAQLGPLLIRIGRNRDLKKCPHCASQLAR